MRNNLRSWENLLVVFLCVGLFSALMVGKFLNMPPSGLHLWAQSDRASIAYTYFQDGNFFLPRTLNVNNDSGIVGVEFPLVYFFVSWLYKLFGPNDLFFRLTTFFLSIIGLLYLFKTIRIHHVSISMSMFIVAFFIASPIYAYYACNFLPDSHALALFFVGFYFVVKRNLSKVYNTPWLPLLFLTCASLIKVTFTIYIIAFFVAELATFSFQAFDYKRFFKSCTVFALSILTIGAWYFYARWLNVHYNSGVFLMSSVTPGSLHQYLLYVQEAFLNWGSDFFNPPSLLLLFVLLVLLLLRIKFVAVWLKIYLVTSSVQLAVISYLFAGQFVHHDYYFHIFFPFVFVTILAYFSSLRIDRPPLVLILPICILLLWSLIGTAEKVAARNFDFSRYNVQNTNHQILRITDKVAKEIASKVGNQRIIVIHDESMNIVLYKLKCFGVPINYLASEGSIDYYFKRQDLRYVLFLDKEVAKQDIFSPYLGEIVYSQENFMLCKIKH